MMGSSKQREGRREGKGREGGVEIEINYDEALIHNPGQGTGRKEGVPEGYITGTRSQTLIS